MAILLGVLAVGTSMIAVWIAHKADRKMQALADLNYDEKLAVFAGIRNKVKDDCSTAAIESIRNNFRAISSLYNFASKKRREELINNYIIPILETVTKRGNLDHGSVIALHDVIEIALRHDIERERIRMLQQRLRGEQS